MKKNISVTEKINILEKNISEMSEEMRDLKNSIYSALINKKRTDLEEILAKACRPFWMSADYKKKLDKEVKTKKH